MHGAGSRRRRSKGLWRHQARLVVTAAAWSAEGNSFRSVVGPRLLAERPRHARRFLPVIALHAIWSRDLRLCVWAEDSALPPRAPMRRGRPPVKPRPRAHPFACGTEALDGVLRRVCPKLEPGALVERDLCLLLPSFRDGPQPSPHLLRADNDDAAAGRAEFLHPWFVAVASVGPADAVDVLLGLPRADEPGIAVGDSPRFLAEVAKLALELLARGRVLPTLAWPDDQWLARWQPVTIDPGDSVRVRLLADSMPPLLRAEVGLSEHGRRPEAVVGRRARRGRRRVCPALPVRRSGRAARTAPVALGRRSVAGGADGRRPRRAGGRAGARGARRGARRVASGDRAVRRAPDVPDLLSAVRARGAGRAAGGWPRV